MKRLLFALALTFAARAETLPPLPYNDHADLGYLPFEGIFPPLNCDDQGNCTGRYHYIPEAESPDTHWVAVAIFDEDIDSWLWLWHDGEYSNSHIQGPDIITFAIDNNGVAKGIAFPCSVGANSGFPDYGPNGAFEFSTDVGCIAAEQPGGGDGGSGGEPASVPESSSVALLGAALVGVGIWKKGR